MVRKIRTENGEPVEDRIVECPDCGEKVPESKLGEHDCPEDDA